jgi:hypothetical protein
LPQHITAEVRFRFGIGLARLTIEFFEARPRVFNRFGYVALDIYGGCVAN